MPRAYDIIKSNDKDDFVRLITEAVQKGGYVNKFAYDRQLVHDEDYGHEREEETFVALMEFMV
jgi:hypothetical protein